MEKERSFYERLKEKGVSRRDFMKYCTALTTTMGLSSSFVPKVAEVFAAPVQRPPVVWLHFAECTGCTESILRTSSPWMDELLFDTISLDYHETLMAAAGHTVETLLTDAANAYEGQFFCVVEGSIPTADNGIYGTIGYTYDAAGNLIEEKRADGTYMKPVYDDTNRMESVSQ